jgi:hypothetical protein
MQNEKTVLKVNDDPAKLIAEAIKETLYKDGDSHSREGNCTGCNEPYSEVGVLVGDVCYDCSILCKRCNVNPADPQQVVCPECATALGSQQCVKCDFLHYCGAPDTKPDSDECIELKDMLIQNVEKADRLFAV